MRERQGSGSKEGSPGIAEKEAKINNFKKILIINPFGIGDVLFTTPIIHTLKDSFPDVKIGYLCNRRTASLLENNPHIDYLFIYERDEFEAIRKKSTFNWLKQIVVFLYQIKSWIFSY